jgi:hypothetical protein
VRLLIVAAVAAALGAGGGWLLFNALDEDDAPEPAASAPWNTCTNPIKGFSIDYPAGWYTDHPAPELACLFFDPRRFEVPKDGDFTGTALEIRLGGAFDDVLAEMTESQFWEARTQEETEAAGRRAVRIEGQSSGKLFERGTVAYGYVIDREGEAFVVVTSSTVGIDYTPWKQIVDKAVRTVRFTQPAQRAVEGSNVAPPQLGLPAAVARTRAQIWKAAKGGDYEAVAGLAAEGFRYTFGGEVAGGGPAAYWRRLDQTTNERPLETLAAILELPYVHQPRSNLYVWPHAFARRAPTLSLEERERLAEALGEETVKLYERLGTYLGYRAGIDEDGDWVFYVAGD